MKKIINVAEAILVNNECKVLLQLRDSKDNLFGAGKWGFIGGSKNKKENFSECIIREIKEELGIIKNDFELIDTVDDRDKNTFFKHKIFFGVINIAAYAIKLKEGKEIKFFATEEIGSLVTVPWFQRVYSNSIKKLIALKKIY